jgi:chitodextrinase
LSPLFGAASSTSTQNVVAGADADVSEVHPDSNDGGATTLRVDGTSPMTNAYLRFDLSGVTGSIASATLRVYAENGGQAGFDVHSVPDSSWDESAITWSTAPPMGTSVGSSGPVDKDQWVSVDVTQAVQAGGPVSFAITNPEASPLVLASREDTPEAPVLVVQTASADTAVPSVPSGLSVGSTTQTSIALSWNASTDNVGVVGYDLLVNGSKVGTTTSTSDTFTSLTCGTSYTLGVDAFDAAGNSSSVSSVVAATTACPDTAPSVPSGLSVGSTTQTSIALSWNASTDNVGVAGYDVSVDGSKVDTTTSTSYTFTGLTCGTSHTLGVDAFDAAGNRSAAASVPAATAACSSSGYQHVVWVVMENHSYSQIIGNVASAPYINQLAETYGSATQMFAESHPSLPNYIAMTSGSTQGITDDSGPSSHPLNVANIFTQAGSNGRALEESMPSNCGKSDSGNYAVRHDPAVYYTNYAQCGTQVVPLGSTPDLSAAFTFITPNLCHDMHSNSCSGSSDVILQGDQWLRTFIPSLLATPQYLAGNTAIFVTWDEDNTCSGCNNRVPTIVISPTTTAIQSGTTFNHYSMLRTTEEILGLPLIGGAATATSMRSAFHL